MNDFDKIVKTPENIKDEIIKDFARDLINEIYKLVALYGKNKTLILQVQWESHFYI